MTTKRHNDTNAVNVAVTILRGRGYYARAMENKPGFLKVIHVQRLKDGSEGSITTVMRPAEMYDFLDARKEI